MLSQRESNWESWIAPPSYSDACQGLLAVWVQWDVKRLQERTGDSGCLTTPLFISFKPSPFNPVERCGDITGWMDGTRIRWVRAENAWGGRKKMMAHTKKCMSVVPFTKHWSHVAAFFVFYEICGLLFKLNLFSKRKTRTSMSQREFSM